MNILTYSRTILATRVMTFTIRPYKSLKIRSCRNQHTVVRCNLTLRCRNILCLYLQSKCININIIICIFICRSCMQVLWVVDFNTCSKNTIRVEECLLTCKIYLSILNICRLCSTCCVYSSRVKYIITKNVIFYSVCIRWIHVILHTPNRTYGKLLICRVIIVRLILIGSCRHSYILFLPVSNSLISSYT